MKKLLLSLAFALTAFAAQAQLTNGCVTLAWNNPNPSGLTEATCLYHSTNNILPFAQWTKIATGPGDSTNQTVFVPPGLHFFTLTLSNAWGETAPCNIVGTPAQLGIAVSLRISGMYLTNGP